MKKTKIIAMYLPQYHCIKENNEWWGDGYTDWVAVKNAKPLYQNHNEPRKPLNNYYYDLSNPNDIAMQVDLAKKYGIYGFGIYHYWFSSNQVLLDTPAKIINQNKDLNINYFFMWDNGNWKRTWSNVKFSNSWAPLYEQKNDGPEILAELIYGGKEEWKKHFDYLLPYFKDERYIKKDNMPLFGIFNQNNNSQILMQMFDFWNKCAIDVGFDGILIIGKTNANNVNISNYYFDYEPSTHSWIGKNNFVKAIWRIKDNFRLKFGRLKKYDYSKVWKRIIKDFPKKCNALPSCFVRYDDSPRRGIKGSIVVNESPEKFEFYLKKYLKKCEKYDKDFLLMTAWNEWGEGAYLEPDETNGYAYLEALKNAINE